MTSSVAEAAEAAVTSAQALSPQIAVEEQVLAGSPSPAPSVTMATVESLCHLPRLHTHLPLRASASSPPLLAKPSEGRICPSALAGPLRAYALAALAGPSVMAKPSVELWPGHEVRDLSTLQPGCS